MLQRCGWRLTCQLADKAAAGAEEQAAGALAADASAGAGDEKGTSGLEIVSQELVPASQALAVRTPETGASTGNRFKGEQKERQGPNTPVSNGPGKDMKDAQSSRVEAVRSDGMTSPKGPPVSHGPPSFVTPEGHRQSIPPLFTPEQSARLNEIHRPALLGVPPRWNPAEGELGYGGGDRSALQNMFATFLHIFGQMSPDLTGRMQRDEAWELQVAQTIDQLGVQLRASQSENHRLRQERQELREALERKGHSRCGTPEERSSVSFAKEGGAAAQQGPPQKEEEAESRQEHLFKEDGAAAQQGSLRREERTGQRPRKKGTCKTQQVISLRRSLKQEEERRRPISRL